MDNRLVVVALKRLKRAGEYVGFEEERERRLRMRRESDVGAIRKTERD